MMLCLVQMRGVCDLITRTVRGPEGGRNIPADSVAHHSLSFFALIVVLLLAVAGVVTLIVSIIAGDLDHKFAKPLISTFSGTLGTRTQTTCSQFLILG